MHGYQTDILLRRHANYGPNQGHCPPTCLNCPRSFERVGLHDKLYEVSPTSFHKDGISRICGRLPYALPRDKIRKVRKECQALLDSPLVKVRQLPKLLGHLTSTIQAVFPVPLHFRHLQNEKNRALVHFQTCNSATFPSGQRGIGLVEGQPGGMEWKSSGFGFSRLSNRDRCLTAGLGGILQRSGHSG